MAEYPLFMILVHRFENKSKQQTCNEIISRSSEMQVLAFHLDCSINLQAKSLGTTEDEAERRCGHELFHIVFALNEMAVQHIGSEQEIYESELFLIFGNFCLGVQFWTTT